MPDKRNLDSKGFILAPAFKDYHFIMERKLGLMLRLVNSWHQIGKRQLGQEAEFNTPNPSHPDTFPAIYLFYLGLTS